MVSSFSFLCAFVLYLHVHVDTHTCSLRAYHIVYMISCIQPPGFVGLTFFGRNIVFDYIMTYKSARELRAYHNAYLASVIVVLKFNNPCDCIFLSCFSHAHLCSYVQPPGLSYRVSSLRALRGYPLWYE